METSHAIFCHAREALNCLKEADTHTAMVHLKSFVLPALAERVLSEKPPAPESDAWNELIRALIDAKDRKSKS